MRKWAVGITAFGLLVTLVFLLFAPPTMLLDPGEYDRTSVTVHDENGTLLETAEVRVADTREKRQVGLSRTDSLEPDEGMLFVHSETDTHTYNMRNMSFPLDIVFVAANGTITEIHHASPADGFFGDTYTGEGKYVLEVERNWTTTNGVERGDTVQIPDNVTASDSWPWFL